MAHQTAVSLEKTLPARPRGVERPRRHLAHQAAMSLDNVKSTSSRAQERWAPQVSLPMGNTVRARYSQEDIHPRAAEEPVPTPNGSQSREAYNQCPSPGPEQFDDPRPSNQPSTCNLRSSGQRNLPVVYPALPLPSSQPDPESSRYSPTSSDLDALEALEESFLNLDIDSTQTEAGTNPKSTSQNVSSAKSKYNQGGRGRSRAAQLSPSSSLDNLEVYMSSSIEARLPLVWRKWNTFLVLGTE